MRWDGLKVFISGIDGFVGSHIARVLLKKGAQVCGVLHKPVEIGKSGLLVWGITDSIRTYIGDIANKNFLESSLKNFNPQWIFHLAAQPIVTEAQINHFYTLETNVKGTYNLLYSASTVLKVDGIILASSDKAYGISPDLPITEKMPLRGGSIYDTSKACADLIASSYSKWLDLPLGITRCANIYGPGDLHFSRIVPGTIKALVSGNRPVIRGSGLHERDFIYIDDVVSGYLNLAEYVNENRIRGEAFNFGMGTPIKIKDIVQMIIDIENSDVKEAIILGKDSPAEIMKQTVDATKARDCLGWYPKVSLSDGLKRTIDWYHDYLNC